MRLLCIICLIVAALAFVAGLVARLQGAPLQIGVSGGVEPGTLLSVTMTFLLASIALVLLGNK